MKVTFGTRLEAIEWIAQYVEDEGQFEVFREELNFNHIYSGQFYLELDQPIGEVVLTNGEKGPR